MPQISKDTLAFLVFAFLLSGVVFGLDVFLWLSPESILEVLRQIPDSVIASTLVMLAITRIVAAGLFLLFAPGYALVAALFPRNDALTLGERGVFSVGSSLALVGLAGVVLAETPWGVRVTTVFAAQLVLIGLFLLVAEFRRSKIPPSSRADPASEFANVIISLWTKRSVVGGGDRILQVIILAAVLMTVGATAYVIVSPLPGEQYTEFYVVGPDGTVDGLPETVDSNGSVEFLVGIHNHEHEAMTYDMKVQITDTGTVTEVYTESASLAHGEEFEESVTLEVDTTAEKITIQFLLFEGDSPPGPVNPHNADFFTAVQLEVTESE